MSSLDDLVARAKSNGYQPGAHRAQDGIRQTHKKADDTIYRQDRAFQLWRGWRVAFGLDPEEYLHPNGPTPPNEVVKDFLRFYVDAQKGRIEERLNEVTLGHFYTAFCKSYEALTRNAFEEEDKKEIREWIVNVLIKDEKKVTSRRYEKNNFTVLDLAKLLQSLWTKDDKITHERMRVQLHLAILLYCYTGGRIAEFISDTGRGLTWKDLELYLVAVPDGPPKFVMKVFQRWVKNNPDPENNARCVSIYEEDCLIFDPVPFLQSLALADGAFDGIDTPKALWEQEVPPGNLLFKLRWKPEMMDKPVFRSVSSAGIVLDTPLTSSTFNTLLKNALEIAGYYGRITIHSMRRGVANSVDKVSTSAEKGGLLGHSNDNIYEKDYQARLTSIDVQGAFQKRKACYDYISLLQSAIVHQADSLPTKPPASVSDALSQDPQLLHLKARLRDLTTSEGKGDPVAISSVKKEIRRYQQQQYKAALQCHRDEFLDARYYETIRSKGKCEVPGELPPDTDRVRVLYHILPQRKFMASMVMITDPTPQTQKLEATMHLYNLCIKDYEVMYRPGEEPVNGMCPVESCRKSIGGIAEKRQRSNHIHACRAREFEARYHTSGRYCYLCLKWTGLNKIDWQAHCRNHLETLDSRRCDVFWYRHTVIAPGHCPFCMGDEKLPEDVRMKMWTDSGYLLGHIDRHIAAWDPTKPCPHPLCNARMESVQDLRYHFRDQHGLWTVSWSGNGCKKPKPEAGDDISRPNPKRAKKSIRNETARKKLSVIQWSPSLIVNSTEPSSQTQSTRGVEGTSEGEDSDVCFLRCTELRRPDSAKTPIKDKTIEGELHVIQRSQSVLNSTEARDPSSHIQSTPNVDLTLPGTSENEGDLDVCFLRCEPRSQPLTDAKSGRMVEDRPRNAHEEANDGVICPDEDESALYQICVAAREDLTPDVPKCPWCQAPVPNAPSQRGRGRLTVLQQKAFCRDHKLRKAQLQWREFGYPLIDWEHLESRLVRFTEPLRLMVRQVSPSHFRSSLASAITRGVSSRKRVMANGSTAGYYGPRGMDTMAEFITNTFASELNRRATKDWIIKHVGVPEYVISVLTPELASMLIKDDMNVDDEEARAILKRSEAMGMSLNDVE